jgi:hypothetical protein
MAREKNPLRLSVDYGLDMGEDYEGGLDDVIVNVLNEQDKNVARDTFDFALLEAQAEETARRSRLYGLNKLLSDRTSEIKDKRKKLAAMRELFEYFVDGGEWIKERAGSLGVVSVNVEALAELKKWSIPQTQKALAKYTKEQREKFLSRKDVQAIADRLTKERKEAAELSLDDLDSEE